MRAALIIAVAFLAAAASDAEARGRRGGRSVGVGVGVGVGASVPISRARASEQKALAEQPGFVRPILPVRAPAQTTASETTRPASAGCTSGRLVGQGSGFCEIN